MSGRSKAKVSRWHWEHVWKCHAWFGFTVAEIAESLKLHHSTVAYYLRKGPPKNFAEATTMQQFDGGQLADNKTPIVRESSASSQRQRSAGTVVPFERKKKAE